ncbi:type IV secretory system conjugative DNA transfer family protein [Kribbella sp. NPDC049174]|uniref:type IV secretory system conjugative DNA transfer family protein n=1 Tax=Kribbella sp. NPDC049174 TaxID=3364112 RepID=UPI00371020AF
MSKQVRGQIENRPRLPKSGTVRERETTDLAAIGRGAAAVAGLFNPVVALVSILAVYVVHKVPGLRKQPGRKLFFLSLIPTVIVVLATVWRLYAKPYVEAWDAFANGPGNPLADLRAAAAAKWPLWIAEQLPVAVTLAATIAFGILWRRQRYHADFREVTQNADPTAVAATVAAIDRPGPVIHVPSTDELELRLGARVSDADTYTLPGSSVSLHMLIVGPTGFGKTTTVDRLTWELTASPAAAHLRNPHIMFDLKGDPDVIEARRRMAAAAGKRVHVITADGRGATTTYNPLRHGTAAQISNKLMQTEAASADGGFSEPFYRAVGERWLHLACRALLDLVEQQVQHVDTRGRRRAWRRDLTDLVELLHPTRMGRVAGSLSAQVGADVQRFLVDEGDSNLVKSVSGIYHRFAGISESAAGPVLVDEPGGLDLYQAIADGDYVIFSLNAAADMSAARRIGNLALQDLVLLSDRLQNEGFRHTGRRCFVIVDEFSGLGGSALHAFYARARSAGIIAGIATQSVADLRAVSDEFHDAVRTNGNVIILHQQKGDSADEWAKWIGTVQGFQETLQVTDDRDSLGITTSASGVGSLRYVDKFRVHPNELKELGQGEIIVMVSHPERTQDQVAVALAPQLPPAPAPVVEPPTSAQRPVDVLSPAGPDPVGTEVPTESQASTGRDELSPDELADLFGSSAAADDDQAGAR